MEKQNTDEKISSNSNIKSEYEVDDIINNLLR